MSTNSMIILLLNSPQKYDLQGFAYKSVDIRHAYFTSFDQTPFLYGVELQAFDRMCALAGII